MSRSKRIFAAFAIVFALFLAYVVYDISSRTTFPGRSSGKDADRSINADSSAADTTSVKRP